MALKFIAGKKQGELTSAREVCDKFKTPFDTTAKVMQKMNAGGILNSVKGIKGGYTLSRSLAEVTYMELAVLIEERSMGRICETEKGLCENYSLCNIIHPVDELNRVLTDFLKELSLEELLMGSGRLVPSLIDNVNRKEVKI